MSRFNSQPLKALKIWTDVRPDVSADNRVCRSYALLPVGVAGSPCPKCGNHSLIGAMISENAVASDPNILCLSCGYWRNCKKSEQIVSE